jgi:hypothetical protein
MKKNFYKMFGANKAFTLAEVLAALVLSSMILIAALSVYNSAQRASAAITRKLENYFKPVEILQKIAEDIDDIAGDDKAVKILIPKKAIDNGFWVSQLKIQKSYYDAKDKQQVLETIDWQTAYDFDTDGLVLYRSRSGIGLEDKLLDQNRENWEKGLFIPICSGVTFFDVQVLSNDELQDYWTEDSLPKVIVITISFAQPYENLNGELEVPEEEKIIRAIAVDRTRKINISFIKKEK